MSLDKATVARIARLARIEVPEEALAPMARELDTILTFVEQLGQVNTDGVAPMTSVTPMRLRMREDRVSDGGDAARVLSNAPEAQDGFFVVPKVVE
ncbi:MAG: Asp-tRNA(Asn)/Glu-tRNA(Gln) amidotransferase subunit GatC [Alphaproteobacteria bacterium]|nr:Asp-tRNA(Asn)/Glu-tRNA(Gln) amidotransferase subunit GatC [Alphaproteobacteria bacterium]